jgi:hypothetical protein
MKLFPFSEVRMKRNFIVLAAALAVLPAVLVAHHSFTAEYDGTKPMELIGVISKVDQQNPHGFFYLTVPSATPSGRETKWALETPGPNQLVRTGFNEIYQQMIANKEKVTVRAYPARDGSKRAFAETLTRADGRTVLTISVGGVSGAVGRAAPANSAVTVDGVAVPQPDAGARGGAGGRGQRGGTQ